MSKSISQLKEIVKQGNTLETIQLYKEELRHQKEHKHMNITSYIHEYNEIFKQFCINKQYHDKLDKIDKEIIMTYMEQKYGVTTNKLKIENCATEFKAPELKLWLLISRKK